MGSKPPASGAGSRYHRCRRTRNAQERPGRLQHRSGGNYPHASGRRAAAPAGIAADLDAHRPRRRRLPRARSRPDPSARAAGLRVSRPATPRASARCRSPRRDAQREKSAASSAEARRRGREPRRRSADSIHDGIGELRSARAGPTVTIESTPPSSARARASAAYPPRSSACGASLSLVPGWIATGGGPGPEGSRETQLQPLGAIGECEGTRRGRRGRRPDTEPARRCARSGSSCRGCRRARSVGEQGPARAPGRRAGVGDARAAPERSADRHAALQDRVEVDDEIEAARSQLAPRSPGGGRGGAVKPVAPMTRLWRSSLARKDDHLVEPGLALARTLAEAKAPPARRGVRRG